MKCMVEVDWPHWRVKREYWGTLQFLKTLLYALALEIASIQENVEIAELPIYCHLDLNDPLSDYSQTNT